MNTKWLMSSSAVFMAILGLILLILPDDILNLMGASSIILRGILQLTGGLYIAFSLLNWNAKANLIGGIYSKPVAIGNFLHFAIGSILLIKTAVMISPVSYVGWLLTGIYTIFAVCFGIVLFGDPLDKSGS